MKLVVKMDLKKYAIGTLTLALLISLGFNVVPDATHFCRDLEIGKYCDHLSSTEKTCYPYDFTTRGKKYCSTGWEVLLKEEQKIEETTERSNQYCCSFKGCKEGACN